MRKIICAIVMAAACSQAQAADLPAAPAPVKSFYVPGYSWSGYYIGLLAGGNWGRMTDSTIATTASVHGWTAGGLTGFNVQSGNIVYGAEADFAAGSTTGSDVGAGGVIAKGDVQFSGHLRARLGYAFDRFMIFTAGGLAVADPNITRAASNTTGHLVVGWTAGGGVEYAAWSGFILRAEYLFSSFGSQSYTFATVPVSSISSKLDQLHTFRGALIWKF